jgi:hypothetical protein
MAKVVHIKGMDGAAWNGPAVEEVSPGVFEERYQKRVTDPEAIKLTSPNGGTYILTVTDEGQLVAEKEATVSDS